MKTETKNQELNIFQAMAKITSEVEAIGKNKINELQKYKFRGIDDLYNTLHGLYGGYGITITSEPVNSFREERTTKNGGLLIYSIIDYKFRFYAPDGSNLETTVRGEGMDSSDKSSNKAFSAALKYALMSMHLIPTEDLADGDRETPEPTPKSNTEKKDEKKEVKAEGEKDDITVKVNGCKNVTELSKLYTSLTTAEQNEYKDLFTTKKGTFNGH